MSLTAGIDLGLNAREVPLEQGKGKRRVGRNLMNRVSSPCLLLCPSYKWKSGISS